MRGLSRPRCRNEKADFVVGFFFFSACVTIAQRLRLHGQQIGVAREQPSSVEFLAQDRERVAGAAYRRRAAGRRDREIDMVAQEGPVTEDLDFLNVAGAVDTDALHARGRGHEGFLAEGVLPRTQKTTTSP